MIRAFRIALPVATAVVATALGASPAGAEREPAPEPEPGPEVDGELDHLGEDLDEAFRDWGELDIEPEPDPDPDVDREVHPDFPDPRDDLRPAFYDAATWPTADVERPLALGPRMVEVRTSLIADLSEGRRFDPVSLAPDVYYGVTERFTIGVVHTRFMSLGLSDDTEDDEPENGGRAAFGALGPGAPSARAGDGLCLGDACPRPYDNVGFDARLALGAMRGRIQLRAQVGMEATSLQPFQLGTRVGITGRVGLGPVALLVDPAVRFGLVRRDTGNENAFALPVTAQLQATSRVVAELSSGAYGPLTDVRDRIQVPLFAGVLYAISPALDVGASLGFPGIVGGEAAPGHSMRMAVAHVAYRL